MNYVKHMIATGAAAAALLTSVAAADAGGLFGCKGSGALFRGSVGCAMEPVQKEVLTPVLRQTVEQGGAAAGAAGAAWLGLPPQVGAQFGGALGQGINDLARGGRGSVPAPAPVPIGQSPMSQPTWSPMPQPPYGNFCATPFGRFGPGHPLPVGSFCTAFVPGMGPVPGQITF